MTTTTLAIADTPENTMQLFKFENVSTGDSFALSA